MAGIRNPIKSELGLPIGFPLGDWKAAEVPPRTAMVGTWCRVEPIDRETHAADLFRAFSDDLEGRNWIYLSYGPFETMAEFDTWMKDTCLGPDPLFYAVVDRKNNKALGVASYLRITPAMGVIEVGHINYAPQLKKSIAGTEAMYLMMKRAFEELGYRRYEWKCDALNSVSRNAAERLGMTFEGVFRQATIYKNRNRDTAWFSILDVEWPRMKKAFELWLHPNNFSEDGSQVHRLQDLVSDEGL